MPYNFERCYYGLFAQPNVYTYIFFMHEVPVCSKLSQAGPRQSRHRVVVVIASHIHDITCT